MYQRTENVLRLHCVVFLRHSVASLLTLSVAREKHFGSEEVVVAPHGQTQGVQVAGKGEGWIGGWVELLV
jgi:hypothetical protein